MSVASFHDPLRSSLLNATRRVSGYEIMGTSAVFFEIM